MPPDQLSVARAKTAFAFVTEKQLGNLQTLLPTLLHIDPQLKSCATADSLRILQLIHDVVAAIVHLHSHDIIHRYFFLVTTSSK